MQPNNPSATSAPERKPKMPWILAAMATLLLCSGCQDLSPGPYNTFKPPLKDAVKLQSVTFTNRIDPQWLQPPEDLFTLGPGDRIDIDLIGETNTLTQTVVGPDGKVYFSLLPGVDVWGLTLGEAKGRMEKELARFVRDRPQVSLALRGVESKRIWILGRVQLPGVYPLQTPMTLLEAIANAGGTMSLSSYQDQSAAGINEELADLKRSFVLRQGKLLPVDFERLLK
ncbi:MAG TPA: polysaccharide biosynthesis/export family protein, partial [Clostridia bacterium]|nr:polysaccharide biosynthesis/export family protein [Clostridia bacterium]